MKRLRVGVLFGGRSGEHEVSIASATSVLDALDREKYEPVAIGITREGQWLIADSPERLLRSQVTPELPGTEEAVADVSHHGIVPAGRHNGLVRHDSAVDVIFPLLHGPFGEDGTVQGLLELAMVPYVGSGVMASAICMDKIMMKTVLAQAGLPSVPYHLVVLRHGALDPLGQAKSLETSLSYPMFVKPCNLGSSVGISKARDRDELAEALQLAARYDRRLIVEQGVDAREVEASVLGNDDPIVSAVGEVISHHEFYDYEAKYTEGLADLRIPARITAEQTRRVQELALRAFRAVDAAGLARVDFFIRRSDGEVIVNEINTMPGFTMTSMYPKLWEHGGISFAELVDRLVQLAVQSHAEKQNRSTHR
jgi:D-alanine-D-alanine ligase